MLTGDKIILFCDTIHLGMRNLASATASLSESANCVVTEN